MSSIFVKHTQHPTHLSVLHRSSAEQQQQQQQQPLMNRELVEAARRDELRQARAFLSRYTEAECDHLVNAADPVTGFTPLHNSVMKGHRNMTLYLLDNKADPNAYDNRGWSPAHWAISLGHTEILCHLLRYRTRLDDPALSESYIDFASHQRLEICQDSTLIVNPVHLSKINGILDQAYSTGDHSDLHQIYLHVHSKLTDNEKQRWSMVDILQRVDEAIAFAESCLASNPLPGNKANATGVIESDEEDDGLGDISSDDDDDDDQNQDGNSSSPDSTSPDDDE